MPLLVTGSLAFDSVTTPYGHVECVLGGAAAYFSVCASWYVPVRLVAVVGDDFPREFRELLESRPIDLAGLEVRRGSKTFRWSGRFGGTMNEAQTINRQLNVLGEPPPKVPPAFADSDPVFLANTHPTSQRDVLSQLEGPELVVCDSMDHWIATERDSLLQTLRLVTGVIINDAEARQIAGRQQTIEAGTAILEFGPKFVMIKKGEHGSVLVSPAGVYPLPGFPTTSVCDPTGAGDSFAGGVMGYLAQQGRADTDSLRRAMVHGTVAASFAIEDFSLRRLQRVTRAEVDQRLKQFLSLLRVD